MRNIWYGQINRAMYCGITGYFGIRINDAWWEEISRLSVGRLFGTLWAKKSGCIIIHILEFKGLIILTSFTYELTLIVSSRSIVKQRLVGWGKRLVEELILRGWMYIIIFILGPNFFFFFFN